MSSSVFIIPGFHDSGPAHWQSWVQARLPDTTRLQQVDWERPDLTAWVDQAHRQLRQLQHPVWLLAHSFGCLVAATLAAECPMAIAGILFVAPADPRRFAIHGGLRNTRADHTPQAMPSVADILPESLPSSVRSAVLASENDPWLNFRDAVSMARRWHSEFVNLGEAGHVNTESGYGPWPGLLHQLERLRQAEIQDFSGLKRHNLERGEPALDETVAGGYSAWRDPQDTAFLPRFAF